MSFDLGIDPASCDEVCDCRSAIYSWCVRQAAGFFERGGHEQAARWAMTAAGHAVGEGFFGSMGDPVLEEILLKIGRSLPCSPAPARERAAGRNEYLHVLSEAHAVGGHTRLCQRWIENDSKANRHHVVLTSQRTPVPGGLRQAVEAQGGTFAVLGAELPLIDRAIQLRNLACSHADAVFLHTHMDDPLHVLAFAVDDVPPVVLVNHADHLYWLGLSVADLVADIRPSGQELTKHCRGLENSVILPLPLETPARLGGGNSPVPEQRKSARAGLGIPDESVVFLTIGSEYKYRAIHHYDFVRAAEQILERCPNAWLVAVGPKRRARWAGAAKRRGGRLLALGVREDLAPFYAMADIHLESFPFGSFTAMLEAGLRGLPCIGAPRQTPLPYRSDGVALRSALLPATVQDCIDTAVQLADDPPRRKGLGDKLRKEIEEQHCGDGWMKGLAGLYARIPARHRPNACRPTRLLSKEQRDYWISFQPKRDIASLARAFGAVYDRMRYRGLPLAGGLDQELEDTLKSRLRSLSRPGGKRGCLCGIYACEGRRALAGGEAKRVRDYLLKSLRWDFANRQNIVLAGLLVFACLGLGSRAGQNT